jgi:hypothetical protein
MLGVRRASRNDDRCTEDEEEGDEFGGGQGRQLERLAARDPRYAPPARGEGRCEERGSDAIAQRLPAERRVVGQVRESTATVKTTQSLAR